MEPQTRVTGFERRSTELAKRVAGLSAREIKYILREVLVADRFLDDGRRRQEKPGRKQKKTEG